MKKIYLLKTRIKALQNTKRKEPTELTLYN